MPNFDHSTFDLSQLPDAEDDYFEFKSSQTLDKELGKKIQKAASGFANSGGGCFICGVDDTGTPDGGISVKVGKQDRRDWLDVQLNQVVPTPTYEIRQINETNGAGIISEGSALFLIFIAESCVGPHIAPDSRYYIRAGAHTLPARHFVIDAIWAKRHFSKPRLTHLFRLKPGSDTTIQLGIVALTDSPAVDCKIDLLPVPGLLEKLPEAFPLQVSMIDRNNPFFFDVSFYAGYARDNKTFGDDVHLTVEYCDLAKESYTYEKDLQIEGSVTPLNVHRDHSKKIADSLESISKSLAKPATTRESTVKTRISLPLPPRDAFPKIEAQLLKLLDEMSSDLQRYPFGRELILMPKRVMYNSDPNNIVFSYFFEEHDWLRGKFRMLENYSLVYDITYNSVPRFVISEELAEYLLSRQLKQPETVLDSAE